MFLFLGKYSFRRSDGSWFITVLSQIISKYWKSLDLLSMLTIVNSEVVKGFKSKIPKHKELNGRQIIPQITSQLRRKVCFYSKDEREARAVYV